MSKLNGSYGFISLLYSISDNPLCLWSKRVSADGRIRRVPDEMLNGDKVIEIRGPEDSPNINTNISCPASSKDLLNIRLPVLAIVLKNLKARVQIAFQLLDEENVRRKFILSTRESEQPPAVEPEAAHLTLKLVEGWNLLEINLRTLCRTTYCTEYRALQRLIIYPNCRVRRIYLQDRHYEHDETPVELCQAFFDMYMLKWGIHFVEKSSQTTETAQQDKSVEERPKSPLENRLPVPDPKSKIAKSVSSDETSSSKRKGKRLMKRKENLGKDNADKSGDKKAKLSKPRTKKRKESSAKSRKESNSSAVASTPIKIDENLKRAADLFDKCESKFSNSPSVDAKDPIIVSSIGRILPELKSTSQLIASLAPVGNIPQEVEAEAKEATRIVEAKRSKLLTTDETVGRFLELRHVINRKMLENFGVRGLTMTEVELSIYNSMHRRNSYGQGNLVQKHRTSVDKACHAAEPCNANEESKQ